MNDFGVRVFPSSSSNAIRNSVKVLHYAPAPADPPIDYTLRVKPNSNGTYFTINEFLFLLTISKYEPHTHRFCGLKGKNRWERAFLSTSWGEIFYREILLSTTTIMIQVINIRAKISKQQSRRYLRMFC
ncbi:unnamed protein product [Haemonchus placei]|uniref:MSP domain-containing protein n=1 Tax=Haemonchus placei TaxID=6290 RepID=A0A0N4XBQ6_HAEPC|nr:unnamed protein product [Haemonchus placei]